MIKILSLTALWIFSWPCLANVEDSNFGKSVELKEDFVKRSLPPFQYWPMDEKFWNQYQTLYQKKKFKKAMSLIWAQIKRFQKESPEGNEARLAMSQLFLLKKYSYASFLILIDLAENQIGTQIGAAALHELSLLTKDFLYDQRTLTHLFNSNEFDHLHPHTQSFVSYHKALRNMTFGYNKWARKHISQIQPDSYWGHLFQYWSAVGEVAREKIEFAKTQFTRLHDNTSYPFIQQLTGLQLARLEFEEGNFKTASQMYSQLGFSGIRERGRIQLERSWTQYYMGNYSKALGLLYALRSPYFLPSLNPERFVLEMLIYSELCHYEAIPLITEEFHNTYKKAIRAIHRRKPLRHNKTLLNMSLMDKNLQNLANLISQIRQEKNKIKKDKWAQRATKDILVHYNHLDKRLQMEIDFQVERKARQIANELLDTQEQILFINYMSKLDSLRVTQRSEDRDYASEKVSKVTFDKIYWPVEKKFGIREYWTDEFEDYSMLISSRCQDQEDLKDIEKDFK